jgi:hypothetical protein
MQVAETLKPLTRRPAKPDATLSRKGRGQFRASPLPLRERDRVRGFDVSLVINEFGY